MPQSADAIVFPAANQECDAEPERIGKDLDALKTLTRFWQEIRIRAPNKRAWLIN